jgi:hypothetical protein
LRRRQVSRHDRTPRCCSARGAFALVGIRVLRRIHQTSVDPGRSYTPEMPQPPRPCKRPCRGINAN